MAKGPRRRTMNPKRAGMFHITSNCVRDLFLYGKDSVSGNDYNHRRDFLEQRIRELSAEFAIAIAHQALMSSHLHLVLANLPGLVSEWSDAEVLRRVCKIFPYKFKQLGVTDCTPTDQQIATLSEDQAFMEEMRTRLSDPSWFMRQLLQQFAVMCNREDGVKGHLVARRFHHRVITDLRGLVVCGIYVDLNQIAALEVDRPEKSMRTSVGLRIAARQLREAGQHKAASKLDGHLLPICIRGDGQQYPQAGTEGSFRASDEGYYSFSLDDYLEVVDTWGRRERPNKRGKIPAELPPILERLSLDASLKHMVDNYEALFPNAVGSAASLADFSAEHQGIWSNQVKAIQALEQTIAAKPSAKSVARRRRK